MPTYNYTTLDDPFGINTTYAYGINATGQIVGYYNDGNNGNHGFLYSGGSYTTLDNPLAVYGTTAAQGINATGQIVGYYGDVSGIGRGFLYSGGSYTTLDDPFGINGTYATGINATGQIVGFYGDVSGNGHGFLYSGGSYTTLDDPLASPNGTFAQGINDAGQIVGYYYDISNAAHGFLYSGGTYTTLVDNPLAGPNGTFAQGINDAGQIVGYYYDISNAAHGFLYSGGTYTTLDNPSANLTYAYGINAAGQIAGYYYDNIGAHGFLAQPIGGSPPLAKDDIAGVTKGKVVTANAAHGVLANDTDPDHDSLHVSAINGGAANVGHAVAGAYGALTLNADGSYIYAAKGGGLPQQVPQDTFIYTVDDGHGGTSTAKLTVTVVGPGQTYVPGTDGNDTLKASAGQAVLDGGNGNDVLNGGNSTDVLIGGPANDILTGGNGPDTFVFGRNFGKDVLTDLKPNTDHIQFDHTLFANFADVQAHSANDGHGNTVITYDANTITLTGVTPSHLHAGDFFFV